MSGTERAISWDTTVATMLREIAAGAPRAEAYWAQQLAFGPVLVHAVLLRVRRAPLEAEGQASLLLCARLAREALGSLPDVPVTDPAALMLLARRQARALSWRRRRALDRLLRALGEPPPSTEPVVPARMVRPYPLLGFRPCDRLEG